jgi:hypothetical protein
MLKTTYNKYFTQVVHKERTNSVTGAILLNKSDVETANVKYEDDDDKAETLVGDEIIEKPSIIKIHNRYWVLAYGILLNNMINFALYPGVLLEGKISFIKDNDWEVWLIIIVFCIADTVGRTLTGIYWIKSPYLAGVLSLIRLGFFATTFLSAYEISFFSNSVFKLANNALLSLTSGYI